jgi:ankyrin repeat protein
MHFSASIAQLAATFIMTILRVLLRRNLTTEAKQYKEGEIPSGNEKQFSVKELPESHELDLVAMHMAGCKAWNIVTEGDSPNGSHDGDSSESAEQENYANAVSRVFRIRSRLSELAGLRWRGEMDGTAATLTETIDALMNHIWNHPGMISESEANSNEKVFQCRAKVDLATGNCGEGWVKPRIMRDNRGTPWKTNQADIDAIFSLWMYHLRLLRRNSDRGANLWLFNFAGGSSNDIGCTICDWWISRDIDSIEVPDLSSFCRTHNIHGSRILNCTTINNQSSAFPIQGMISSTTSLSHMCSQYILSAFLTAAAAWINPITSETTFHAIQGSRHLKVDNDDVRVLADIIQRSGLATFDDAYRIVVPALFEENSLPDLLEVTNAKKVLDVVKSPLAESSDYDEVICSRVRSLCIDKTSKMISAGKWTDAGNLCMELAGVFAEKLGPEHPETIKMRSSMRQFGERLASESRDPLNSSTTPSNVNLQTDEPKNIHTIKYPLHYAVQNGLEKNFYDILQQSNPSDIDGLCENGITPLGLATSQGNIYLVRLLLFFGANAAGPDKVKRSPLQLAAKTGRSGFSADKGDIIELLILNGANINGGDPTPLQVAVTSGSEDMAILLIERGANFNHMGPDGTSIIHLTAAAGCKAVLTLLLEKKVDPNLKDKGGLEVIHYAVFAGDDAVVRLLLEKKVDPNLKDNRGFAVIHYAVVAGGEVVVRLLLDNGADPDLSDSTGRTAMHWAVERGVEAVVRLLLEKGANLNTKDMDGRSVGYFAKGEEAVERLLKEYDGTRLKYERSVCGE